VVVLLPFDLFLVNAVVVPPFALEAVLDCVRFAGFDTYGFSEVVGVIGENELRVTAVVEQFGEVDKTEAWVRHGFFTVDGENGGF
jgi:hypothetical protein